MSAKDDLWLLCTMIDNPSATLDQRAASFKLATASVVLIPYYVKGLRRWRDRFVHYGTKVSFWGSETLKIVIPVENYPPKRSLRVNAALFIFLAVFLGVCLDDGRSFGGERCPKVVNCTQVCASMRRVGDRYPDSSGAGPSNKPPPPRGMLARPCRGFVKSLGVGPSLQRSSALH